MTLIIPAGNNSLPVLCDTIDGEPGVLTRSVVDFSDDCVTSHLNRHSSASLKISDLTSSENPANDVVYPSEDVQQFEETAFETPSVCSSEENTPVNETGLIISRHCKEVSPVIYECTITLDSVAKLSNQMDQSTNSSGDLGFLDISRRTEINELSQKVGQVESLTECSEAPIQLQIPSQPFKSHITYGSATSDQVLRSEHSRSLAEHNIDEETNNLINRVSIVNSQCNDLGPLDTRKEEVYLISPNECPSEINLNEEKKKMRQNKLLQRRSISETSSQDSDFGYLKKTRDKLRHSFSAYENCDKLQKILDKTFLHCKYPVSEGDQRSGDLYPALNCERTMEKVNGVCFRSNESLEKISRKSCIEITDTLVNNAKKSMIEEYKNLKKNSSMAKHTPNGTIKLYMEKEGDGFSTNVVTEAVGKQETTEIETEPRDTALAKGGNAIPQSEIRCCRVPNECKTAHGFIPQIESKIMNDFHQPKSLLLKDGNINCWEDRTKEVNISSPPTRLEIWKNILAEKRNSIRNHIRGLGKLTDNYTRSNDSNNNNDTESSAPQMVISSSEEIVTGLHHDEMNKSESQSLGIPSTLTGSIHHRHCRKEGTPEIVSSSETCPDLFSFGPLGNQNRCLQINGSVSCSKSTDIKTFSSEVSSASTHDKDSLSDKVSDTKVRLNEACHGIAVALHSLPRTRELRSSRNKNEQSPKDYSPKESNQIHAPDIMNSSIASFITTISPPITMELSKNEKAQQCPTPPTYLSDDEIRREKNDENLSPSTEDDSDYCQTDECGEDCDYSSGAEAEDEEEDVCELCRHQNVSNTNLICKHTRVMTNGSLKTRRQQMQGENGNIVHSGPLPMVPQSGFRKRNIKYQELSAIREYSNTSEDQLETDEESHDDNMYDISSSWRFGLCDNLRSSIDSTIESEKNVNHLSPECSLTFTRLKSNSLPVSSSRNPLTTDMPRRPGSAILKRSSNPDEELNSLTISPGGIRLPPRPPRSYKTSNGSPISSTGTDGFTPNMQPINLRPTMGLQSLHQRPLCKHPRTSALPTGPKTLTPRSPVNPNPPFGFPSPPSPPKPTHGSPFQGRRSPVDPPPSSPRTNSRSGALVTRNFSISDDEGGQRLARRQVTITRHESVYKEAADKGYPLPPSSPIDPYWLTWKLGVLQKTVEEVGSRLGESEKVVGEWGPVPHDQNLADQYVHNIRKFRETLPDLQRGIDDVNDQAARFSAHNVPLSPSNSAALHDLNNRWKNLETNVNDRWRQMAGRSREVAPLTPAQLASSVSPPWERATATNKVPYYINHAQETTHWDHPFMMDLLDSLSEYNHIKFSAYRTATKMRSLQKKLALDSAKLQLVTDVFDEHGLRGQNDRLIDVNDMVVVLSTLYGRISSDNSELNTTLATDLCLNWLLNVYDSQRTGQMRVLSFRVGLICLCRGHLEEKYRYMFRLIADPNRLVDQRKLGLLLHDCVQVPRQLGEVAAFGGSNIEPSVRSCFTKAGKDREMIEAVHFLTWVQQEPQSLVWLAVLHRVAASESVQHQVKCNICKTYPIVGLRYRCLKCLSFDMCQRCFFEGRSTKSHKITHPMHEYCTATTAGDEMKDFTKALKNKFKSKRSLQKHTKKGYLPVQTVLEGDPLESPSPSPSHNVSSQDMHSRLELYASRLAEVELRTNSNSTPDSEDEHGLIAQYCQSLSSSDAPFPVPKSPLQIMASVDADQKDELEQMIRDLEEENRALQAEYERLKLEQPSGSISDEGPNHRSEAEMLAEAKLLREHKGRLEARMAILEDHNRQLEAQLQRLRQLLVEQSGMGSPNKSGTLQTKSVTASQLAMDSPAKINGHSSQGGSGSAYEGLDQMSDYVRPPPPPVGSITHMGNLFSRAGDLEKAVGNLVASMNQKKESDSLNGNHSGNHSDENDYDNTVSTVQSKSN